MIDGLYVDGIHQIMARYPNYRENQLPLGSVASQEDIKRRSANYKNVAGGYLRAIHCAGWGGNSYFITGKDDSPLGLSLKWVGDNNRGSSYHTDMLVIENIFEELDEPNEWYYEKESGLLYYYPPTDCNLDECRVEIAVNAELLQINNAENITIDGIQFKRTSRTLFSGKPYVPLLRGDWAIIRSGAVFLENCDRVIIQNCFFTDIYGNAVFISGKNSNHLIDNNEFEKIGSSCIQVVGMSSSLYEPSFWEHEHYEGNPAYPVHKTLVEFPDKSGPKTDDYPKDIVISENHMHKIGIYEKQSCGVNVSAAQNVIIRKNTIHNSARSCININDGSFGGHEIAYNDLFDSQRETKAHGSFNSWGRDRFWTVPQMDGAGRNGREVKPYALLDAVSTVKIHNNSFYHAPKAPFSWGIDLDDGSTNYEIYENLCMGCGIKLREGFYRTVYNNIIIGAQIQLHCTYHGANDSISQNLIINSYPWGFAGHEGGDRLRLSDGQEAIDKNWYFLSGQNIRLPEFWQTLKYDLQGIVDQNPLFRNPQRNDYTVCNQEAMDKIGFHNFPMDQFGKTECQYHSPIFPMKEISPVCLLLEIRWLGAVISNIDQAIMSATSTAGTDGVYFKEVPVTSEAYQLGYRSNTVVKTCKGKPVKSVDDFLAMWE